MKTNQYNMLLLPLELDSDNSYEVAHCCDLVGNWHAHKGPFLLMILHAESKKTEITACCISDTSHQMTKNCLHVAQHNEGPVSNMD